MTNTTAEPAPPQELCDRLRAAADRLLAGTPLHSDGKLTILSLAQEAGVKRWLLTHKYPHQLKDKYAAEFKAAENKPVPVRDAERELEEVREQLRTSREEKRQADELVRAYALIIAQLADELAAVTAECDTLKIAGNVTRLPLRS